MANLIVRRPRGKRFGDGMRSYRILIDGKRVASIDAGKTLEIAIGPGRHTVTARVDFLGSQPVEIDGDREEPHRLAVLHDPRVDRILSRCAMLPSLVPMGHIIWELAGGRVADSSWLRSFTFPASLLPFALVVVFLRAHYLAIGEIPSPGWAGQQEAAILGSRPIPRRVTIGQSMIAVALGRF